jgi:alpha-1,6-mannosyltransferase
MIRRKILRNAPGGLIPLAGVILLAAWIPLIFQPSLIGKGVIPFLCSFVTAGLAYLWSLKRLSMETPELWVIWFIAVFARTILLITPVSLSSDVYRYIWDGHLLLNGVNPYAHIVQSTVLDAYQTPLRALVNFPWMATPYLPAAQVYYAIIEFIMPQSPFAFQIAAALCDLGTGLVIMNILKILRIPARAVLVYLWNPLIIVEFSHGAHVDALMVFFFSLALYGLVNHTRWGSLYSVLALATSTLVKGWTVIAAPIFIPRWGPWRTALYGLAVALPIVGFAYGAGWGISGPADGRGVFGALLIYSATWYFNSGLFVWIARLAGDQLARLVSILLPGAAGLILGVLSWNLEKPKPGISSCQVRNDRTLVRWTIIPFGLYLIFTPTVHPWYLALVLSMLPYCWPGDGEDEQVRRWIWPWIYFMFFEAFTYLAYSGVQRPGSLNWIQTIAYLPFWILLVRAALPDMRKSLDLLKVS